MPSDPVDRLRVSDPLAGTRLPDSQDPDARALLDAILADGVPSRLMAHRRRRTLAIAAVAAAGALGTAAAIAVVTTRPADPTRLGCYAGPSTTADTAVVGAVGDNPVDQCRQLWQQGEMDPAVSTLEDVPGLVACVLQGTVLGVFPASSCDDIDTSGAPWEPSELPMATTTPSAPSTVTTPSSPPPEVSLPDFNTDDRAVREALNEIRLAMLDRCLSLDAAIALAEDTLREHGIEDWTVAPIFEGHGPNTCVGFFPDAAEQAVWFTPEETGEPEAG